MPETASFCDRDYSGRRKINSISLFATRLCTSYWHQLLCTNENLISVAIPFNNTTKATSRLRSRIHDAFTSGAQVSNGQYLCFSITILFSEMYLSRTAFIEMTTPLALQKFFLCTIGGQWRLTLTPKREPWFWQAYWCRLWSQRRHSY